MADSSDLYLGYDTPQAKQAAEEAARRQAQDSVRYWFTRLLGRVPTGGELARYVNVYDPGNPHELSVRISQEFQHEVASRIAARPAARQQLREDVLTAGRQEQARGKARAGEAAATADIRDRRGIEDAARQQQETLRRLESFPSPVHPEQTIHPSEVDTPEKLADYLRRRKSDDPVNRQLVEAARQYGGVATEPTPFGRFINTPGPGRFRVGSKPASAEEQALAAKAASGAPLSQQELARAYMLRLSRHELHDPHATRRKAANIAAMAYIAAVGGIVGGPMLGPVLGATLGGATGGALGGAAQGAVASKGDTDAMLRGAALGGVTGGLGPALGTALPAGTGAAGRFASGAAKSGAQSAAHVGLTKALGGEANPWDILASALVGGALNAVPRSPALLQGSDPEGIGDFTIGPDKAGRFLQSLGRSGEATALKKLLGPLLPEGRTGFAPPSPDRTGSSPEQIKAARDAALASERESLLRTVREHQARYNAAREAALARHQSQLDEYRSQQAKALSRLREQAVGYLEQVRSVRQAPLPPIPIPQAPPAPPPPDPFDPSAALAGRRFSGDFQVSAAPGDFPVSRQAAPQPVETFGINIDPSAPEPAPKAAARRLPLNLLSLQAALARRR